MSNPRGGVNTGWRMRNPYVHVIRKDSAKPVAVQPKRQGEGLGFVQGWKPLTRGRDAEKCDELVWRLGELGARVIDGSRAGGSASEELACVGRDWGRGHGWIQRP